MAAPFDQDNSYALLIGVGKRNAPDESAYMAVSAEDATRLEQGLIALSILPKDNISKIIDQAASKTGVIKLLQEFAARTADKLAELVIIFFSGHGYADADGNFYLICNNTRKDKFPGSALTGDAFVTALMNIRCDKMLVLLDCCQAGAFNHKAIELTKVAVPFNEKEFLKSHNRVIITASENSQSSSVSNPISVFTYAILEALQGDLQISLMDKELTVLDLAMDVRERVVALSNEIFKDKDPRPGPQQPQLKILQNGETKNYLLREFPKGKEGKKFLTEKLMAFDSSGKSFEVKVNVTPRKKEDIPSEFIWFKNTYNIIQQTGDHNTANIYNAPVTINMLPGADLNEELLKIQKKANIEDAILNELKQDGAIYKAYELTYWKMGESKDKISLHFDIPSFQEIGFNSYDEPDTFKDELLALKQNGIKRESYHYDDLCQGTINKSHILLTKNEIYNFDRGIVNPVSEVIGQYLFRLLFGENEFRTLLRKIKNTNQELEIVLHFNVSPDSLQLAKLPWEAMYCPPTKFLPEGQKLKEEDKGFFISKVAAIYRKYEETEKAAQKTETPGTSTGSVKVTVAFLSRSDDSLNHNFSAYVTMAQRIGSIKDSIRFNFLNKVRDGQVYPLMLNDFKDRISSPSSSDITSKEINILHLVCDLAPDKLHFAKENTLTEPISISDVFDDITSLISTTYTLIVLQAWREEEGAIYKGFEDMAISFMENPVSIVSMPYIVNINNAQYGRSAFFQVLYSGITHGISFQSIIQKLRSVMVSQYVYGFPILYLNGTKQIIPSKEGFSANQQPWDLLKRSTSMSDKPGTIEAEKPLKDGIADPDPSKKLQEQQKQEEQKEQQKEPDKQEQPGQNLLNTRLEHGKQK